MNTVTPSFVRQCGLEVSSINDLNRHCGRIPVSCSGGYYIEPLGYILIQVQFPGIPSYDEEQVALVIQDGSEFSRWVPFIVGTPIIDWVIWVLKESEMETALEEWQRAQIAHECVNEFFMRSMNPAEPMPTNTNQNPLDLTKRSYWRINVQFPDLSLLWYGVRPTRPWWWGTDSMSWHRRPTWRTEPTYW